MKCHGVGRYLGHQVISSCQSRCRMMANSSGMAVPKEFYVFGPSPTGQRQAAYGELWPRIMKTSSGRLPRREVRHNFYIHSPACLLMTSPDRCMQLTPHICPPFSISPKSTTVEVSRPVTPFPAHFFPLAPWRVSPFPFLYGCHKLARVMRLMIRAASPQAKAVRFGVVYPIC